jgi:hypothetical protein
VRRGCAAGAPAPAVVLIPRAPDYIVQYMQILIDLDEETLRDLERAAPAKSRQRSAFIRAAIKKSLWELEEDKTRKAYLRHPDPEPVPFDPGVWEPLPFGGFDPPAKRAARPRSSKARRSRASRK